MQRPITLRRFGYALSIAWAVCALTYEIHAAKLHTEIVTANIARFCSGPGPEAPQTFRTCMAGTEESLNLQGASENAVLRALWPIPAAWLAGYFLAVFSSRRRHANL